MIERNIQIAIREVIWLADFSHDLLWYSALYLGEAGTEPSDKNEKTLTCCCDTRISYLRASILYILYILFTHHPLITYNAQGVAVVSEQCVTITETSLKNITLVNFLIILILIIVVAANINEGKSLNDDYGDCSSKYLLANNTNG